MKAFKIKYANKEQKEKHQAAMREMGKLLAKICNENPEEVKAVSQDIEREKKAAK